MAINLTVALTDSEQAVVQAVALVEQPGATAAQIKAWAERFCKQELRTEILRLKRAQDADADRAVLAARQEADATNFPEVP